MEKREWELAGTAQVSSACRETSAAELRLATEYLQVN